MPFENTVLGRSNVMTSERGSAMAGRLIMKSGLLIIDHTSAGSYRAVHGSHPGDAMKTVLITGWSSGYGLETARYFHSQGWNVVATMRTPRADTLPRSERLRVLALDVTRLESIAAALEAAGPIDVLVNNAGIG